MRKSLLAIAALLLFVTLFAGCGPKSSQNRHPDTIVVAVSADFDHLNPLLIQMSLAREVCTMIYPSLVRPSFDEKSGAISYQANAAERWEFSPDGRSVTFHLKRDALWEDGKPLTSKDFSFSYRLYADPNVASSRQDYLYDLLLKADGSVDFDRAVETPDSKTLVLRFNKPMSESIALDHFNDLMPVAEHLFRDIPPAEIRQRAATLPIVGAGPFKVKEWQRQSKLTLESSPTSVLPRPAASPKLTFMIVPEYTTRLAMLKSGQIDALVSAGGINPKDASELARSNPEISIIPVADRYFDSVVWLNIDGEAWRNRKAVQPNRLFGDPRVRQAMTRAIDRQAIIDGFMGPEYATIVNTTLSPAYTSIIDQSLPAWAYDSGKALSLLREAGWTPGPDGILQKNGLRFSFELAAPTGNPRRNYAATIIQQNLREIGIDCKLKFDEALMFNKNQNEYRYDAALSGLAAETLPFQLVIWGSDFEKKPFNSSAFQNAQLDKVVSQLTGPLPEAEQKKLWQEYQRILVEEQPRTFLYYYSELEGFNKRVRNVRLSLLATLGNMYEWKVGKSEK
ncbi:peptide-binding protein [Chlorobaculum sp. 24CR]|uniref:peptide-binding protein n=1 Tax=Chlorobaculum sp. 24CR TaxID=2508878 RepID=UPI00143153BF|nr:peptide-binding protein [Chlorobaculum sp. 24CR]